MTLLPFLSNAGLAARFQHIFRPRDIFLHDGSTLRRVRLGVGPQVGLALAALLLLAWTFFSAAQFALGTPFGQTAANRAQVEAMRAKVAGIEARYLAVKQEAASRAARLEERQKVLTAIVAGKTDAATLASLLPAEGDLMASVQAASPIAPLDRAARAQLALVDAARDSAERRYAETRAALRKLGLDPRRFQAAPGGMGGPYEPISAKELERLKAGDAADPQFKALFSSWKKLDALQQNVISVPSQRPVRDISFTSGYGVRSDPFRGSAAMHAGIDLAGPIGTPIYATADGVVSHAGWLGGYGNLVELEHGKGIATRYGHLSRILVRVGQHVRRGDLIAKMGSTGRSTGSHLHYEVRLDGRAVNPLPFLQSADYLLAVQRRAQATQVAMGGPDE